MDACDEKDRLIRKLTEKQEVLSDARELMLKVSIVNELTDFVGDYERMQDIPKQIRISDYTYAFIKFYKVHKAGFELWIWNEDQWNTVSDLTGVYVFEYQELKSYAVAVGMITEDEDLFI